MEYLRTVTDDQQKLDAVTRIHELAERFAPDTQWFLDIMNQVGLAMPQAFVRDSGRHKEPACLPDLSCLHYVLCSALCLA